MSFTLYGETYETKNACVRALRLNDYDDLRYHIEREAQGLPYVAKKKRGQSQETGDMSSAEKRVYHNRQRTERKHAAPEAAAPSVPKPKVAKPVTKVTAKKKAPNRSFTQYPKAGKAGDEPQGIRLIQHSDYLAELERDRLQAGSDWNDSAQAYFEQFRGRG